MKLTVLTKVGETITRVGGRAVLTVRKFSPEILIGLGVVGVGAGVIECCRATRNLDDIMAERQKTMDHIEQAREVAMDEEKAAAVGLEYTEQDYNTDLIKVNARTVRDLVKNYALGGILVLSGVGCFLGAYGILHARNVALAASYAALSEAFENYRNTVNKLYGPYADEAVKSDLVEEQEANPDAPPFTPNQYSPYAKVFDESSIWWRPSADHNKSFVIDTRNRMNDKLRRQSHLFLNEVYDAMDLPRTKAGAIVGWVLNNPKGNGYVDFNIVTLKDGRIWIDFNVDGIIYNLI